jgi:hypothetical protein
MCRWKKIEPFCCLTVLRQSCCRISHVGHFYLWQGILDTNGKDRTTVVPLNILLFYENRIKFNRS